METGLILAIIASASFAVGIVLARKTAGEAGEAFSVTTFSILAGIPIFAIVITISGEWYKLTGISGRALGMLAAAGVIHFIAGRLLAYESFRLIGANRSMPFTQTSPIYTIILSLIFLQEKITGFVALGAVFMLTGAFLITQEKKSFTGEIKKKFSRDEVKGILFALGAALCWGITPVLIKPAVEESGSAVVGTLAAYLAAAVIIVIMLGDRTRRKRLTGLSLRKNMLLMAVAGIFTAAGQLLYFTSLERSPANVIAPLMSIQLLFIFLLSYFINRRIELFSLKVALGIGATVAGTILLFQ